MRITPLVVAALVCVPAVAAAETPVQKETSIWQAFKDKKADAFKSQFAPNYIGLYEDGQKSVAGEIDAMDKSKIDSFKIDGFKSHMVGPNDMLMTYTVEVKGMTGKDDISGKYEAASWWHRANGKWLGVYHTEIKAK
jgi:Domain of unknown function (DUF4440)